MAAGVLAALTLAMFYDVLFGAGDAVLSKEGADLSDQFVYWRAFGFGELGRGNLALWNPHIYSGAPYLGGMQSALLYPPNWLFLILPPAPAFNIGIALHVFALGIFMYLWARYRRLHPASALLSAALLMFCGAHFPHIYAGHVPNLCTMAWTPLLFLAIDGLARKPSLRWCLLGISAVTMQILAGHPQYLFYTGVAAVIYLVFRLIKAERRKLVALGFVGMYAGAVCLGAVQLLTAFQAAGQSVRSGGISYEFASMFSLPPENFLTLLAPGFFGDIDSSSYWGRCYLWEMSLFVSVTGLVLAACGVAWGRRKIILPAIGMVVITLLLALGSHTPLFRLLYDFVPGFDKFRGNSKFIFLASLFITLLAGVGFDALIKGNRAGRKTLIVVAASAVLVAIAAVSIYSAAGADEVLKNSWWRQAVGAVEKTGESYLPAETFRDPAFIQKAGNAASGSMFIASGTLCVVFVILLAARFSPRLVYLLALLAVAEIFVFARTNRPVFRLSRIENPALRDFLDSAPGDFRVLNMVSHNNGMMTGAKDLWGYDPGVLRRYAEFMTHTQGGSADEATQYVIFRKPNRLYSMLRLRYVFARRKGGRLRTIEENDPMPRLQLLYDYKVIADRDGIFAAMDDPQFNPRKTVILQSDPSIKPIQPPRRGEVRLVDSSTDHLTIKADLPAPAILLITDTYSIGWRASGLPGSVQDDYDVLPGNYVLRAVPLRAGKHHIRLEYLPSAFIAGKWISAASVLIYLSAIGWLLLKRRSRKKQKAS